VRYNSIAPLDERLKTLRLPFSDQVTQFEALTALRGAIIEVRSGGGSFVGKLLSVEKSTKQLTPQQSIEVTRFAVVTDRGEIRSFELGPGTSVRLVDADLNRELGRYLDLIGSFRSRDLRRMTISAQGQGPRERIRSSHSAHWG
jgi:hypothetical protein